MKNKVLRIVFTISLLVSISLSCLLGYAYCNRNDERKTPGPALNKYVHPTFQTEYTEEEHVERLTALVEDIYEEKIENGDIKSFTVEILHAYYDYDPEYFLIEFDGFGRTGPSMDHLSMEKAHLIGFIENDIYKLNLPNYKIGWQETEGGIFKIPQPMEGESPYKQLTLGNRRKYFGGGVYGVYYREKEAIVELPFDRESRTYSIGEPLVEKRQKTLMSDSSVVWRCQLQSRVEFRKQLI